MQLRRIAAPAALALALTLTACQDTGGPVIATAAPKPAPAVSAQASKGVGLPLPIPGGGAKDDHKTWTFEAKWKLPKDQPDVDIVIKIGGGRPFTIRTPEDNPWSESYPGSRDDAVWMKVVPHHPTNSRQYNLRCAIRLYGHYVSGPRNRPPSRGRTRAAHWIPRSCRLLARCRSEAGLSTPTPKVRSGPTCMSTVTA